MNTRSGQLRYQVSILADNSAEADEIPSWSTTVYDNYPCNIEDVSGQESYRGVRIEATTTHLITMRHAPNINPRNLIYEAQTGRIFEVVSVTDKRGRYRELYIQATTVSRSELEGAFIQPLGNNE